VLFLKLQNFIKVKLRNQIFVISLRGTKKSLSAYAGTKNRMLPTGAKKEASDLAFATLGFASGDNTREI